MSALPQRASALADLVGELHALRHDPVESGFGVVGQHLDQVEVSDIVAAVVGLQSIPSFGIEDIGAVGSLVLIEFLADNVLEFLVSIADRLLGQRRFDGGALRVGHRLNGLQGLVGGVVDSAADQRIAADSAALFDQDDGFRAVLQGGDRSGQTGTAGTDDDYISGQLFGFGSSLFRGSLPLVGVRAGSLQGVLDGVLDRIAGNGRAGDGVHIVGLGIHDALRQHGDRRVAFEAFFSQGSADTGRFLMSGDLNFFNLVRADSHSYDNLVVLTQGRSFIRAGIHGGLRGLSHADSAYADDHHHRQQQSKQFAHNAFLL